jgi:thiamine biosynthesis lipoprotein
MHVLFILAIVLGCLLLALGATVRFLPRTELPSRSVRSMGGLATLTVSAGYAERLDSLAVQVQSIFERLEQELSAHRPDSAISRLTQQAGIAPVALSEDASRVLELALEFDKLSEGASDITVAPVVKLWGFGSPPNTTAIPSEEVTRERLRFVDSRRVILEDGTAFLPLKGMAVDLGGIAKGYAVDRAYEYCRSVGVEHFLIDLSGNIRVSGRPQWGKKWRIGVRNPFDRSAILGSIALPSGLALATSGNYERFVEIMGQRYAHIINPKTGMPATGTAGVTVLCRDATTADGLSTALFVLGLKGCGKLLAKAAPAEILMVPDKYPVEIWMTRGFAELFISLPDFSSARRLLKDPN